LDLYSDAGRARLRRRAPQDGAAAKPIVVMAHESRRMRKSRGAASSAVVGKSSDGEGAYRLASRVSGQLDPLNVDISEQACRSSEPTAAETMVKPGVLL
jgi:hypothetical protein